MKWTAEAISAAAMMPWPSFHEEFPDYTFDAWEVKRRRATKRLEADAAFEVEDTLTASHGPMTHSAIAHLGPMMATPDVVNFHIAFFDFETTDLKANFGRLLCLSVANDRGEVITIRADEPRFVGRSRRDDSRLAVAARDLLESYDILVGWNSKRFDLRFLNGRLMLAQGDDGSPERPMRADIMHVDNLYTSRYYAAWHSHRLDAIAKTLRTPHQKTDILPDVWQAAIEGEQWAMDYIVEHCEHDVLVLRDVFERYRRHIRIVHR